MAQNPFDQLAKQYLEDILTPIGQVTCNLEIPGESKFVDVFFSPTQPPPTDLGLLGRIIQTPCSLEPFRNAPSRQEIRTCWMKLLWSPKPPSSPSTNSPKPQTPSGSDS